MAAPSDASSGCWGERAIREPTNRLCAPNSDCRRGFLRRWRPRPKSLAGQPIELDPGRVDHRGLHVITIDPADARDHDDAVSVQPLEQGLSEVGIHIADVTYYVRPGSALDEEAYRRGTSVYLVDGVVPMLPEALSAGVCSLRAGEDRRALSLFVTVDPEGTVRRHRIERTLISCREGIDYGLAQSILDGRETGSDETRRTLETLHLLAKNLRKRRLDRGALELDLPEANVVLGSDGRPRDIVRRERHDTHRLIEELMVLANELVAAEALRRKWPVLFRTHEAPDPDRTERLADVVSTFGYAVQVPVTAHRLQGILDRSRGTAAEAVVHTAVLRSLKRAEYTPDRPGHFGLASKAYAHFTSPIRRYPDLHLHRVITDGWMARKAPSGSIAGASLAEAGLALSAAERRADGAQRDSVDLAKVELMESRLGDVFDGWISSVHPFGLFVQLDELFVDGLVHISTLDDDYYELHQRTASLIGVNHGQIFRLGDRVRVQVARVDRAERQIDFVLLETLPADPPGVESGDPTPHAERMPNGFDTPGGAAYPRPNSDSGRQRR